MLKKRLNEQVKPTAKPGFPATQQKNPEKASVPETMKNEYDAGAALLMDLFKDNKPEEALSNKSPEEIAEEVERVYSKK